MCGIAGFSLNPDENIDARDLSIELLRGIETRGRHATGVAVANRNTVQVQKAALPASDFVRTLDLDAAATTAILHTRYATQGSPNNPVNNHPIRSGNIVGVHNGVLSNDDELFDRLPTGSRQGEVDSEAIFATLAYGDEKAAQALNRVEGGAAVAWLNSATDVEVLHLARVSMFPVSWLSTEAGSLLFASTDHALLDAVQALDLTVAAGPYSMPEGQYMRVRHGNILATQRIQPTTPVNFSERQRAQMHAANGGARPVVCS